MNTGIIISDDGQYVEVRDRVLAAYIEANMQFFASRIQIVVVEDRRTWRCRFKNTPYLRKLAEEFQRSPQKQIFRSLYRAFKKIDCATQMCAILNTVNKRRAKEIPQQ